MVSRPATGIYSLPNELLIQILSSFATRALLALAPTSHRIHSLILRVIHARLLAASSLVDHELILECYHPSDKWSTPGLPCKSLGTYGLPRSDGLVVTIQADASSAESLHKLVGLYSHFRPQEAEQVRRTRRRHPAGDVPGHPNTSSSQDHFDTLQTPSQDVYLDSHELFSQLCTVANLVKVGPRAGLYLSCVPIGDGVIRVFRSWLKDHAVSAQSIVRRERSDVLEHRMLWLDSGKNVGVRLRVIEKENLAGPILLGVGEDPSVSYTLEYEELVIRTTQLLLKTEESVVQEHDHTGKAMIIGSWRE